MHRKLKVKQRRERNKSFSEAGSRRDTSLETERLASAVIGNWFQELNLSLGLGRKFVPMR